MLIQKGCYRVRQNVRCKNVFKSEYQQRVSVCIDQKLIEHAIEYGKSLLNINLMYAYHIGEVSKIYREPIEHYSKVMACAYHKTIKQC